jgi:Ca2+:H+ antiporter
VHIIQHRYLFAPEAAEGEDDRLAGDEPDDAGRRTSARRFHLAAVIITFTTVAILSKYMAEVMDEGIQLLHLPAMLAPLAVAVLALSPKAIEAMQAALANDVQRAVNIGLGSAVSTVALAVPAMLAIGFLVGQPITLALTTVQQVVIALTIVMAINNYKDGDVNTMAGTMHFAIFTAYVAALLTGA